ncbi:hypothetical protein VHEMI00312 [[Torrubiella] hemipterigena]|uniref:Metallo-beta-lactamase domain-containing protein n=1 Tax=[Torrubiella] hemipterigena TaxID=1531966 RepID=A0A0A1T1K8_9HYPO|nr:hypothetical protein VHEMI00312 [[Torrubiella] hemipterigena]
MSTFNGIVDEFPDIRIDFFRKHANIRPPLACFLSHVHSDHLAGLETLRSPFVYCSAATRAMLLKLERYPCRINYSKGILEARKQTYSSLARILKPIPLDTPTKIELAPNTFITVTLIDANHCPGSVMFLIEGGGRAILYTGDIRCEPWHIECLANKSCLLEYTSGIKILDKIYLDTSHLGDVHFQPNAQGIADLVRKVTQYPNDTIFYLHSRTFGYENVWTALAKALDTQVHLDDYKLRVYRCSESPWLNGYVVGNSTHPGCLSSNRQARVHACESRDRCETARQKGIVTIYPVVVLFPDGTGIPEIGVGGGGSDLQREAELDLVDVEDVDQVLQDIILPQGASVEELLVGREKLARARDTGRAVSLDIPVTRMTDDLKSDFQTIQEQAMNKTSLPTQEAIINGDMDLPKVIKFAFARHSSYPEQCELVKLFRPRDVWPCTENLKDWTDKGISVASLFGKYCSGTNFAYDTLLDEFQQMAPTRQEERAHTESQTHSTRYETMTDSVSQNISSPEIIRGVCYDSLQSDQYEPHCLRTRLDTVLSELAEISDSGEDVCYGSVKSLPKRKAQEHVDECSVTTSSNKTRRADIEQSPSQIRHSVYNLMLENASGVNWHTISLISTNDNHSMLDHEL